MAGQHRGKQVLWRVTRREWLLRPWLADNPWPSKRGGPLTEKIRLGPITEDHRKLGVKLGECGAKGALAGGVRAASEVARDGERSVREEVSEAESAHRLAVRLLSRSARSAGVPVGGAQG